MSTPMQHNLNHAKVAARAGVVSWGRAAITPGRNLVLLVALALIISVIQTQWAGTA